MVTNKPDLVTFEAYRKHQDWIPPRGSNVFPTIGEGRIHLTTIDHTRPMFSLMINRGIVHTGPLPIPTPRAIIIPDNFIIDGENGPYSSLTIIQNSHLKLDKRLTILNSEFNIHGTLELMDDSHLDVKNGSQVIFHNDSVLVIKEECRLSIATNASFMIMGRIDIHYDLLHLLDAYNITIDSAALMNVTNIPIDDDREFSLTDYRRELNQRFVNRHVQGDRAFFSGRVGFIWRAGNPVQPSHILGVNLQFGSIPLGDFDFPILGRPINITPDMQLIRDLTIRRGTTLYITELFKVRDLQGNILRTDEYRRPRLRIGRVIEDSDIENSPGECIVHGRIIAEGYRSFIDVDRGGVIKIMEGGEIHLRRNAKIRCSRSDGLKSLYIYGKLIVDDISQIDTFKEENIFLGEHAKIIILNSAGKEDRILFSTPNGIREKDGNGQYRFGVYRLFYNNLDKVEFHIPYGTGIKIDASEAEVGGTYSRHMTDWYGGMRIEKAIHQGMIIWGTGAFIEMDSEITPWVAETFVGNTRNSILLTARLFKSYGSFPDLRLQDMVNRLRYAGFRSITFRFIHGNITGTGFLDLEEINMIGIRNDPVNHKFILRGDNEGIVFLRNNLGNASIRNIIHPASRRENVIHDQDRNRFEAIFALSNNT